MDRYPTFFKPTAQPRVPHENRDRMMERIMEIIELKPKTKDYNEKQWLDYLSHLSELIKSRNESGLKFYKMTKSQFNKCNTHNFWLFGIRTWHLVI